MSEPILSEYEQKVLKAAALMEYQKIWGAPKQQEMLIVCRVIDVFGKLMAEAGSLDA